MPESDNIFQDFVNSSGRSSVGLVTNSVLLSDASVNSIITLITKTQLPQNLMPATVHETMHWETFNTPVGNALSAVFLRAWKNAKLTLENSADSNLSHEIVLDYSRFIFAINLLRPLTEGMALFAEFDLDGGNSSLTTRSTILSGMFFDFGLPEGQEELKSIGERSNWNFFHARQTDLFQKRKEALLLQDFSSSEGEYIHGYYFVKNLQTNLVKKKGLVDLLDTDLFLHCLKSIFFGDIRLARIILDEGLDFVFDDGKEATDTSAFNQFGIRLQELFRDCFIGLDQNYIDQIKTIIGGDGVWSWPQIQPISSFSNQNEDIQKLSRSINNLLNSEKAEETEHKINYEINGIFENRDVLSLGSVNIIYEINDNNRASVWSKKNFNKGGEHPQILFFPEKIVNAGNYEGTLEVYIKFDFDLENIKLFAILRLDGEVVHHLVPSGKDVTDIIDYTQSSQFSQTRYSEMQEDIFKSCKGEYWNILTEPIIDQLKYFPEQIMLKYNSAICEEIYEGNQESMFKGSPFSKMDNDVEFLGNFSEISLLAGSLSDREKFYKYLSILGIEKSQFISKLDLMAKKGSPLGEHGDELITLYL